MAKWLSTVSQKVTTRVQVRSRTIFFPAPARICIAACFASASLLCIAASASKSMQIAMQMAAMQIAASSASLLLHRNRCRSRCSLSPPGLHRFCIASASLLHRFCNAKPPQTPSLINPWSDADCNADGKNRCRILHRSSASYLHQNLHRISCQCSGRTEPGVTNNIARVRSYP